MNKEEMKILSLNSNQEYYENNFFNKKLENSTLENVIFNNCIFSKVNVSNIIFKNCKFYKCKFNDVEFLGSKFNNCSFNHSNFIQAYFLMNKGINRDQLIETCNIENIICSDREGLITDYDFSIIKQNALLIQKNNKNNCSLQPRSSEPLRLSSNIKVSSNNSDNPQKFKYNELLRKKVGGISQYKK